MSRTQEEPRVAEIDPECPARLARSERPDAPRATGAARSWLESLWRPARLWEIGPRAWQRWRRGAITCRATLPFLLGLAVLLALFYWPAVLLRGYFYVGDVFSLNYPARVLYAAGLRSGHVPLWTPGALAGYPILADGQTGAYYPLNLLLYRWLPVPAALNYSILLSFWLAGAGLFLYLRALGLRRGPAFVAACILMLGGFLPAHLNHVNMLAAAAWLPALLWAIERATTSAQRSAWLPVAIIFGLQALAGHPQVLLLAALLAGGQALVGPLAAPGARPTLRRQASQLAWCAAALAAGGLLASVQLAPTCELMRLSQRDQGLTYAFFTTFSLPPAELVTLLSPFVHGSPYPQFSTEFVGYVGILPLVLAALAPWRRRNRAVTFWLAVAALGLVLALGGFDPAYRLLWHVPLLNRFRAPARYLLWFDLAIAILAGTAIDALLASARADKGPSQLWMPAGGLGLVAAGAFGASALPLDRLLASWRWLPAAWLAAAAILLLTLRWHPPTRCWLTLACALVLLDLTAFTAVYSKTYNALMAPAEFTRTPDPVAFLQADAGAEPYRVYTDQRILPGLPVMRESLYPNTQLLHGVQSLNGYFPLQPQPQQWLLEHLTPRLLDLLGVRYILAPQELPTDEPQDFFIAGDRFAPSSAGWSYRTPPQSVAALEVEGFTIHASDLPRGTPVAQIILQGTNSARAVWTLRAGIELPEWSTGPIKEQTTGSGREWVVVARRWPAAFNLGTGDGLGYTYRAHYALSQPMQVGRVVIKALIPQTRLRLERVTLLDLAGNARTLASLAGQGNHVLVYCNPGVAIYRNEGAGPRAFLVHRTRIASSEEQAHELLLSPSFDLRQEAVLAAGQELSGGASEGESVQIEQYEPEYVRLRAAVTAPAYLVLADSFYPGWMARVDGQPSTIQRADVALRAVALSPGEHVVEFSFRPQSWRLGGAVSAVSWLAALALAIVFHRRGDGSGTRLPGRPSAGTPISTRAGER